MCDCFHLAFPNWHAPAPGAGRRLRGPEEDSEIQDSICEEPEILESERPRPQGSSPIEEFPAEKQTREDPYDSPHKSGSIKKVKKIGFGGRLDKRSPAKINETECDDSEVIVTAVKETYTRGLVVTGGKKDGIFIKEVKPDSPASKLLSVKEGDQILSATIYFDNVSHEDALQILECAQPYKMEFCLKRSVMSTGPRHAETALSEGTDGGSPKMRGQRKMKKQQDRISWPKFPSFGKGHKAQFRRSHSTSEAEEQRKLEISPQTSDAESPFKSPLKSPDAKDKRKKHKGKLKMKMKGHRSKSDEEPHKSETSEVLVVLGNQDVVLEGNVSEELVKKSDEVTSNIENGQTLPSLSEMEGENKVNLITLGNALNTANIPVALSEGGKTECSEKEVIINEREMSEVEKENHLICISPEQREFEPSAFDNIIPHPTKETPQVDTYSSKERIGKDSPDENMENKNLELSILTISDVEEDKKSLNIKNIHENVSYGIRTRGPLAGMATSNTHFINTLNGLQFMSPDTGFDATTETSHLKLKSSDGILANLDKTSESKFRINNVDLSAFEINEIKMTEKEKNETHLPKREEIEIPGMEAKELKQNIPGIKIQKIEKIINITKEREIQDSQIKEEFNVKDVKEAVFKFPAFKLPERDITGVLVQREIKIMEMRADKSNLTPKGSPSKIPSPNPESKINKGMTLYSLTGVNENAVKTVDLPYIDDPTITPVHIDYKKPTKKIQQEPDNILRTDNGEPMDVNLKLLKREDIEIPGMEAINECNIQNTEDKTVSHQVSKQDTVIKSDSEKGKKHKTKKQSDTKGQEKKSKRPKTTVSSTSIPKPDFNAIEQKEDSSKRDDAEKKTISDTQKTIDNQIEISDKGLPKKIESDKTKSVDVGKKISVLADNFETKHHVPEEGATEAKGEQTAKKGKVFSPTKFKIPSVTLPQFGSKALKATTNVSSVNVQFKDTEINPNEELKLHTEPLPFCTERHVNKDLPGKSKDTEDIQDTKFKMPKFEISLPEVKAPKITLGLSKKESEINVPEDKTDVSVVDSHELPDAELQDDLDKVDSKSSDMKIKRPGFSFPRIAFSKTETTVPGAEVSIQNVDISLPEGSKHVEEANTKTEILTDNSEQKDSKKYGSPSRFKLPSITFPKFGTKVSKVSEESSEMDSCDIKRHEINVTGAEVELSDEPVLVDVNKNTKPVRVEIKDQKIQSESKDGTFKLPKFEISIPEVKGQLKKAEIDISVPIGNVEVHPLDSEEQYVKADLAEKDMKCPEITMKKTGFSFPRIGFGKSETKPSDADVKADVSLPEARIEVEGPSSDNKLSKEDAGQKDSIKFGSPTKFKLPSISLPKFGVKLPKAKVEVSDVEVADDKKPEINEPEAKLTVEPLEIKGPGVDNKEIKEQDIPIKCKQSAFNLPKFGISLPEGKVEEKIDISLKKAENEISVPEGKEVHPPDETIEVKADLPDVDSKSLDIKIKKPEFTFPSIGFGKSEIKAPEADITILPEAFIDKEGQNTNSKLSKEDSEQQDSTNVASPTRFKIPSISLPKIGVKLPKPKVEVSDIDTDTKETEINVPDAETKLSVKPLSVDIKKPDVDKEAKDLSVEIKEQGIQIKSEDCTFNLSKFGIRLPEVKGPKVDLSLNKVETEILSPEVKVDVQPLDVTKPDVTVEVKAVEPEIISKDPEVKTKRSGFTFPSIGFGKSEIKAPEVDMTLANADVYLPEASIEIEGPSADINLSKEDSGQKDSTKFGSPSKFKLPSISLPKFGTKVSKAKVEVSDVSLDAETKLSVEPLSVEIKGPDVDKKTNVDLNEEMQDQDILMKGKVSTFNLPKFGINLTELKGPKIDLGLKKTETERSVPEGKVDMHPPDVNKPDVTVEVKEDLPETDSKETEIQIKKSGFTFPSIGFGKSEMKVPEVDVTLLNADGSLPEASIEIDGANTYIELPKEDSEEQDETNVASPTKFKLPSISLPKIGVKLPKAKIEVSDVDVDIKRPDIKDAEISAEPLSVKIKGPDADKDIKDLNVEIKEQDTQIKVKESKFNLPKFGISLPEMKGPKIDLSLKKTEIKMSVPQPDVNKQNVTVEEKSEIPEIDSNDLDVRPKRAGFTLGKSEINTSEIDVTLPNVDLSLPETSIKIETPSNEMNLSNEDSEQRHSTTFGSPTKFKLPSISFPKFGVKLSKAKAEVSDVDVKRPEINVPDSEAKVSTEPLSVEITGPGIVNKVKDPNVEMKEQNIPIKGKESTFTLPKFGISLPKVKGPKIDLSLKKTETEMSAPEGKVEVHPPDVNKPDATVEVKTDMPEVDFKDLEVETIRPGFTFPPIGFGKSEIVASEIDVTLPESSIEIEGPSTDIKLSKEDSMQKDSTKFGSPTKFKLPSISLPKFGTKASKAKVQISGVDLDSKRPEIPVPDAEAKLSVEPLSVEMKGPDVDKDAKDFNVKIKEQDIHIKGKESKFNLPKFGISLPEVKGPKIDLNLKKAEPKISVTDGKEVHPPDVNIPDVTVEVKADLPEIDSDVFEVKAKRSGFTFPSIGFGKSEIMAAEIDVTLPNADVYLPEASIEMEGLSTDISTDNKLPKEDSEQQYSTKFGSPKKIKFPSIPHSKFEVKLPNAKVEVSDVDVDGKRPDINLPDAEAKLSVEPLSVEIKGPDIDKEAKDLNVEMKEKDISNNGKASTFTLPKFGISLPEMKKPKIDLSLKKVETEMPVPEGKVDVYPLDVNKPDVTVEEKSHLQEKDSKAFEVKTKRSGFTFPSIGFGKSEMKAPETEVSLSNAEANIEMEGPSPETKMSKEDSGKKDLTKFGSPTKFKLPSISLPKFGTKASKAKVESSDVEEGIERPEINVPDADANLSVKPMSVEIKGPDVEEGKELNLEMKEQDILIKCKESTFNLPKFEICLPEVKGPKIDLSLNKAKTEMPVPEGKLEVHPPDVTKPDVRVKVKADLPDIDSKGLEVKTKQSGFTFPSIGFGKSEMKAPEVDGTPSNADVSLPEASLKMEGPSGEINLSKEGSGQNDSTKFGSPTKFKLPSISLPKFGTKVSKAKVELSGMEVDVKEPEQKLTDKALTVDIKGSDVKVNDQDLPKETKDSKFKLPKFAISLPEIKGPKIDFSTKKADFDISASKGTVEIHIPNVDVQDVKAELKADPPEVFLPEESVEMKKQNTDIQLSKDKSGQKDSRKFGSPTKFKLPSISLPKFVAKGSKLPEEVSEVDVEAKQAEKSLADAAPDTDVFLPNVDVTISKGTQQHAENTSTKESGQKDLKYGSPTKFKIPSISLPKIGVKVTNIMVEENCNVNIDLKTPDIKVPDAEIKMTSEPIKEQNILITGQASLPEVKGPKMNLDCDKVEAAVSKEFSKYEMHKSDVKLQEILSEVKADLPEVGSKVPEVKVKRSGFSMPKFGFSKSESSEADASQQNVNVSSQQESLEMEGASTDDVGRKASGKFESPTKFKLPSIKLPKFGGTKETVDKSYVEVDVKPPEIRLSDSENLSAEPLHKNVDIKLSNVNLKSAIHSLNERDELEINNKVDTQEMAKISMSKFKYRDRDQDSFPDVALQPKINEYAEESSRTFVKAFDVEFYIPTLDEIEEAKKYTSGSPKQEYDSGISQPSVYDNEVVQLDITSEKKEKPTKDKVDQKSVDEPNKNIVFEFASTNKMISVEKKETQTKAEESPLDDKDAEKSSTREIEVDSPTLSLRSSEAFADVSSAPITEQISSPTKVKVTYSESSATAEISDIHSEVFTSTARTELITIVPNQPEKVNIPFSSETSSSSVDTLKEMSGKIHLIKNYMQTELDSQQAALLSDIDTQNIQTLFSKTVAESVMSVEKTTLRKEHKFVEKRVVKEIIDGDQDSSLVKQKIHIFEKEPIPDDTTSSIQKLKDTVHSEKMRFFESGESSKTIIMSTETKISRHDFSKEETEEK